MVERNCREIILPDGGKRKIKNIHDYDLYITRETIKGKSGYFVRVDKNTFGPFMKVLLQKYKDFEDRFMICMVNAVESYVVRVGVRGFEVVEKLNLSNQMEDYWRKSNMAKDLKNVRRIGNNGDYAVYMTKDKKFFVELKGVPLRNLVSYKMYDSYKELYLHFILDFNDNSLFDVNNRFTEYTPNIINQIWRVVKHKQAMANYKGTPYTPTEVKELLREIIRQLKEVFSPEELWECESKAYNKLELFDKDYVDSFNINKYCRKYWDVNGKVCFSMAGKATYEDFVNKARADENLCKIIEGDFVAVINGDIYLFDNGKLQKVSGIDSSKYYFSEKEVEKALQEKSTAYENALMKKCNNVENGLSELDRIIIDFLALNPKYFVVKNTNRVDENMEVNSKNIKNLINASLYNTSIGKYFSIKEASSILETNDAFLNEVKKFIKRTHTDKILNYILIRRQNVVGHAMSKAEKYHQNVGGMFDPAEREGIQQNISLLNTILTGENYDYEDIFGYTARDNSYFNRGVCVGAYNS